MSYLQDWIRYVEQELQKLRAGLAFFLDYGTFKASTPGWYFIRFTRQNTTGRIPSVLATQGPRLQKPTKQYITPPQLSAPKLTAPTIPRVSLTPLQVPQVSPPVSWGDQARAVIREKCGETIGQIPVVGPYLCTGVDYTFGLLAKFVADAIQALYYAFDQRALVQAISQAVEAKVSADWNAVIANLQATLNSLVDGINSQIAQYTQSVNSIAQNITQKAQDAINALYSLINQAIGLAEGLAIPVAQVRNVGMTGFEVYAPGEDTVIYWIAVAI